LIAFSVALAIAAWWKSDALPATERLRSELASEPLQTQISKPTFDTTVDGITYTVRPLYEYDLYGLVVSRHDSKTWWDYIHAEWNDNLNATDLCVVWGKDAHSDLTGKFSFSSGQFVCNFQTNSREAFQAFDQAQLSNNHLLTDDPRLAAKLRRVRVGDQIHFSGYLSEYSHNHGFPFKRGTSTTRTDTGNGACETVFVTGFDLLRKGGGPWRILLWVALALFCLGVVLWWRLPSRYSK